LNSFAVVAYLPEPLAGFVDALRQELVPACRLRAHLTVLPPRPPACAQEAAWDQLKPALQGLAPFPVELQDVLLFPVSQAVYISLGAGCKDLELLHDRLDCGHLKFSEPWPYHPHVTLAQQLDSANVDATLELAVRRWREFSGARRFTLDRLTFVQNIGENRWRDLADCELRRPVLV
jgi:2'-5' RNA ligase